MQGIVVQWTYNYKPIYHGSQFIWKGMRKFSFGSSFPKIKHKFYISLKLKSYNFFGSLCIRPLLLKDENKINIGIFILFFLKKESKSISLCCQYAFSKLCLQQRKFSRRELRVDNIMKGLSECGLWVNQSGSHTYAPVPISLFLSLSLRHHPFLSLSLSHLQKLLSASLCTIFVSVSQQRRLF